jgi:enterochelin esterase-like enzyme
LRPALLLLVFCLSACAQEPSCPNPSSGDLDVVRLESKVFGNARMLRILLPPGYRLVRFATLHYSVLYLNDGQNLFDACTPAPNHEQWRVEETMAALMASGDIPPMIVVGIDHAGIDKAGHSMRPHEYLPYPDDTLQPSDPNPQGKLYPQFLLQEVVPFIERRYRVRLGAANRVLGGASYGAGAALYTLIARPDSFYGLLLESPSVYASDYAMLKDAAGVPQWPRRIFIGTGTVREPVEDVHKLEALFHKSGLDERRLRVVIQEGGEHSETWWGKRLPDAIRFLFAIR